MELRWFGAVLVLCGCGGLGFLAAGSYRSEVKALQQLLDALEVMSMELSCRMMPLPELCGAVAGKADGPVREFFVQLTQLLRSQVAPCAAQCAGIALRRCRQMPKGTAQVLSRFAASLGAYDYESQLSELQKLEQYCTGKLKSLRTDFDTKLRTYRVLGLCAGASLVVFLI